MTPQDGKLDEGRVERALASKEPPEDAAGGVTGAQDPYAERQRMDEASADEIRRWWGKCAFFIGMALVVVPPVAAGISAFGCFGDLFTPEWLRDSGPPYDADLFLYVLMSRGLVLTGTIAAGLALLHTARALIMPLRATVELARAKRGQPEEPDGVSSAAEAVRKISGR